MSGTENYKDGSDLAAEATQPYKVILVDDHALFLSGLKGLLGRYPQFDVVGEAADGQQLNF